MPRGTPKARRLGAELREAREKADLGVREVSRRLGFSHTSLSRYENGERMPEPEDVASILTVLGATGEERKAIIDLAKDPEGSHGLAIGMPERERQLAALLEFEREASAVTAVSPLLVPGLLQTGDHARSIMVAAGVPPVEGETRVAVRLGRRDALTRERPAELDALISEDALRHVVGGPEVMAGQLRYLRTAAQLPTVTARVVPTDSGWHPGLEGPFVLVEFSPARPVVHLENRHSASFRHEPPDVEAYRIAANKVADIAMSAEGSVRLVATMVDTTAGARS